MFMKNMAGAKAAGIKTGIYFYSGAETQEEAVEEASLAVKMANDAGGVDLPIYIDWEGNERTNTVSPADATAIINAFAATVKNAGYKAGVYADRNHLTTSLYPSQFSEDISVWCAQYNTECTYSGRYDMWQYSSRGSIPGISGNVDLDRRN
jgi:GH25 family lysozyme M1 (1,4-beta-N-acetylmuramidase)